MKKTRLAAATALALMLSVSATAQNLRIEPLANNNSLVRIAPEASEKYLLIPIEESAPEAQVKIVADNKLERQLWIRVAKTKVDYYVPMELDEFRGRHLAIYVHSDGSLWKNGVSLSNTFEKSNKEKFRPEYHHTPEYAWMNDPNGMFYKDGEWHLYYQYGPYGSMWNNMTWGHSVSKDLVNWKHEKPVLFPDAHGSIFSGSCIVDKDNTAGFGKNAIIAMYTSAGDVQSQSIAYSLDNGYTFTPYVGNPVLTADIPDFRDPNMFWHEATKRWVLAMSAGQEMRIYSSPNMKDWTEESRFGKELGSHDGVWECPDLMELPVEGSKTGEKRWVLFCNINPGGPAGGSATQYFVGDFDGHKFTVDDTQRYSGKSLWQDYGKDHYATVSFSNAPDGRHTMIAWMSNWQYANSVPTMQYRSANSICREPFLYKASDGKVYLGSRPSPEYDGKGLDNVLKIKGSCTVELSNSQGEKFEIVYDEKKMTLTACRKNSGLVDFSNDFAVDAVAPVRNKITSMRIFVDNSSVEVFANNGEVCLTSIVFPKEKIGNINIRK